MPMFRYSELKIMLDLSKNTTSTIERTAGGESNTTQMSQPFPPAAQAKSRMYVTLGIVCAILSLIIVPEIFGALAIVFGAYAWKKEEGNRGLYVVIIGIIFMIVGIYFTSLFELGDLLPSLSSGNTSAMNLLLLVFN